MLVLCCVPCNRDNIRLAADTYVRRLSLARPLRTLQEGSAERTGPATEEPRPFSRAVLVVEYEEGGALVRAITAAMDHINGRALANIHGSLRAYVLTPEVFKSIPLFRACGQCPALQLSCDPTPSVCRKRYAMQIETGIVLGFGVVGRPISQNPTGAPRVPSIASDWGGGGSRQERISPNCPVASPARCHGCETKYECV